MNLKLFLGRSVLVQMKQPYVYQLARANGSAPVPFAVVIDERGQRLATPQDTKNVQQAIVGIIAGVVIERDGEILLECDEPTEGKRKLEIMVQPDLIGWVTCLGEEKRVIIPS